MYHATQRMLSKAGLDQVVVIRTKNPCPPTKSVQLEVGTGRRTVGCQLIQLTPAPLGCARVQHEKLFLDHLFARIPQCH